MQHIFALLFFVHGLQNILGNRLISDISATWFEFVGGVFSLVCSYLVIKNDSLSQKAVLLRSILGIFSFSALMGTIPSFISLFTGRYIGTVNSNSILFAVLRFWPVLLFVAYSIYYFMKGRELGGPEMKFKFLIWIFMLLVFVNWALSSSLFIFLANFKP